MINTSDRWLYLDDVRQPVSDKFDVVRSYDEFAEYLKTKPMPKLISFDHDLADEHMQDYFKQVAAYGFQTPDYDTYKEKTGLDCAKFLCDYFQKLEWAGFDPKDAFPACGVHSANPVGTEYIQGYINGFKKHMGWEPNCYIGRPEFTMPTTIEK